MDSLAFAVHFLVEVPPLVHCLYGFLDVSLLYFLVWFALRRFGLGQGCSWLCLRVFGVLGVVDAPESDVDGVV